MDAKPVKTQILAERHDFGQQIHVHMRIEQSNGQAVCGLPVRFRADEPDVVYQAYSPMLSLNPNQAQLLIDELWSVGLRPTQGRQSEGQMAATNAHLQDMRVIAFAQLKVQQP
jgi:hypothetical protein